MTQSTFTHQYRLLICAGCGASLSVALDGGPTTCRYCGATSVFKQRAEVSDIASLRGSPAADEYDRYQKLKAQESRQMLPPPGLEHLIVGGGLPVQFLQQAQGEWQALVREVQGGAPMGVHERLFFLTFVLAQTLARGGPEEEARRRGVLETAIEVLAAPPHRYQLRAALTRDAVRHGDLASAEAWLAGCDPRSYDIFADSDYRTAAAYIATARGDWASVFRLVGQRDGDIPLAHPSRRMLELLRANALERTGQLPAALQQMRSIAEREDLEDLLKIQRLNTALNLCPESIGALVREKNNQDSPAAAAPAKPRLVSPIAIPFVLVGLGMIVAGFMADPKARTDDDMMSLNLFFWMMGGFFFLSGVTSGAMIRAFAGKAGLTASADTSGWKRAAGRIVSVQSTGWTINDKPQLAVRLQIFNEALPVYEIDTKICVPPHQVDELKPGITLTVRVDPQNPQNVSAVG